MYRKQLIKNNYYSYLFNPGFCHFSIIGKFIGFNNKNRPMLEPEYIVFHNCDDHGYDPEWSSKDQMKKYIKDMKKTVTNGQLIVHDLRALENFEKAFIADAWKSICPHYVDFYKNWENGNDVKKDNILNKIKIMNANI